jgi:Iron-containing redox enzyme
MPDENPGVFAGATPFLPEPRGPLSDAVLTVLTGARAACDIPVPSVAEPYSDDLQLALHLCYELHYQGFGGVDAELEWDPDLLRLRRHLERSFLAALRADTAEATGRDAASSVDGALAELLVEPLDGSGPSYHLVECGERWQLREYLVHRSIYQLKEADPHSWIVPRLRGQAKASFVSVQHDEYGAGRGEAVHSVLFANMMEAFDLDSRYGHYIDAVPGITMATVNVMTMFGLHRALRAALLGQFALLEITSPPGSDRLLRTIERFDNGAAATRFYDEHVEADAVHEQLVRHGVLGHLLTTEPELAPDVLFGIRAGILLEDRFGEHLISAWQAGRSSLRRPLADAPQLSPAVATARP